LIFQLNLLPHLHPLSTFFSISPQSPSASHTHPQPPPSSPPSICSYLFSLSLSLSAKSSSPSCCQGIIQTANDNNCKDHIRVKVEIFVNKFLGKGELCPYTLVKITKISLVASMWHVLFVWSMKIDDMDQFC